MKIRGQNMLFELPDKQGYEKLYTFFTTDPWTILSVWARQTNIALAQELISIMKHLHRKAMKGFLLRVCQWEYGDSKSPEDNRYCIYK